ncbi:MAG: DUF1642 domain-containing protein [Enterococcus faecium]
MNEKELIDKQELIDELAKYVKSYENAMDEHGQGRYGAYEVSLKLVKRLNESKITDEQAWNKVAEAYPESAQSLRNTLDNAVFGKTGEHQKPVVPKFVAEWFEEKEGGLENAIFYECVRVTDTYSKDYSEFQRWLVSAENNPIETLVRMKDGYEVEKEPLYYVVFDILQEQKFLVKNIKTKLFYLSNNENVIGNYEQVSFTEQEIKAIDKRFWPFAVPVEEVVER